MAALAYLNDEKSVGNDKSSLDVQKNAFEKGTIDSHKETSVEINVDLSLTDVNPLKPLGQVLRRKNNIFVLISSGNNFVSIYDKNVVSITSCRVPIWIYLCNCICIFSNT